MRRLTLLISIALAILAFGVTASAGAKSRHHARHHARVADRNHNGIPDRWEKRFRVHSATADPDRDGVTNIGEFHDGTNPRNPDTNGNGIPDGADDANDDGIPDGQEQSGTITSFDGTILTVTLVNGDTLKGTVDNGTEIECDDSTTAPTTTTTRDGGDDNESGDDNSGTGSATSGPTTGDQQQQGDDDQGDANDQGDDDQGENQGTCGTAALTPTTIVKEAELHLTSAGAVFDKIELGGKAQA